MAEEKKLYKCPDCDKVFDNRFALGPHRQKAHGYRASDGKNDPKRQAKGNPRIVEKRHHASAMFDSKRGQFPCPHCDFVASWTGGLKKHVQAKHNPARKETHQLAKTTQNAQLTVPTSNGNVQAPDDRDHRLQAAATFAAGRVSELLQSIALKHDLPARSLAALVLRVVHAETVR